MNCKRFEIPITVYEGGTFSQAFIWKTGSPAAPVDLSGYTAKMQIRAKLTDVAPILDVPLETASWVEDGPTGIYIDPSSPATGQYRIYLKDDDTQGICALHKDITGVYDLFLLTPAGESVLKQYGVATLIAASTR
jgi:hypothetical protein